MSLTTSTVNSPPLLGKDSSAVFQVQTSLSSSDSPLHNQLPAGANKMADLPRQGSSSSSPVNAGQAQTPPYSLSPTTSTVNSPSLLGKDSSAVFQAQTSSSNSPLHDQLPASVNNTVDLPRQGSSSSSPVNAGQAQTPPYSLSPTTSTVNSPPLLGKDPSAVFQAQTSLSSSDSPLHDQLPASANNTVDLPRQGSSPMSTRTVKLPSRTDWSRTSRKQMALIKCASDEKQLKITSFLDRVVHLVNQNTHLFNQTIGPESDEWSKHTGVSPSLQQLYTNAVKNASRLPQQR